MKWIWIFLCTTLFALDPEVIADKYATGVVKIFLYDHDLVADFDLRDAAGELGRGSGFFVTPEGIIFTNRHVVEWCVVGYVICDWVDENGQEHTKDFLTYTPGLEKDPAIRKIYFAGHANLVVQVFHDERQEKFDLYMAEVVSMGESFDGAMVRIVSPLQGGPIAAPFTALPIGNSDEVSLGERFVILGFPAQYSNSDLSMELKDSITLSQGVSSGWDWVFDSDWGMVKTDAAIHEGNSGGPVFGKGGKVVGIATALGMQTSIGLVGPINAMYWVAKGDEAVFKQLVGLGLTQPSHAGKTDFVSGKPQALPIPQTSFVNPITNQALK